MSGPGRGRLGCARRRSLVRSTGDEDVRSPREVADAIHAAIPRSELVITSGVGHVSCVEAAERFTAEVRDFLHRVVDGVEGR